MQNWKENNNTLTRDFSFENFAAALAFVNRVGELAVRANHHPDILLHDYKQLRITLITHETGGVTQKDHDLAREIDSLLTGDH